MEGLEVAGIAAVVIAAKEVANFVLLGIRKVQAEERHRVEEKEKDDRLQTEAVRRDKVDSTVRAMPAIEEQLRDHEVRLKATEDNMKKVLDNLKTGFLKLQSAISVARGVFTKEEYDETPICVQAAATLAQYSELVAFGKEEAKAIADRKQGLMRFQPGAEKPKYHLWDLGIPA